MRSHFTDPMSGEGDAVSSTTGPTDAPTQGGIIDFMKASESLRERIHEWRNQEVVWFPVNDLSSPERPFLLPGEEFAFEMLPLQEVNRRIYQKQYDFDKYMAHQMESAAMSVACSFLIGSIYGGAGGYYEGLAVVNEQKNQYKGQLLSSKQRAEIYNSGARLIRRHVGIGAVLAGIKFMTLAGTFCGVNLGVMSLRQQSDPINFTAGGLAAGSVAGLIQGGVRGMVRGGASLGGIALLVSGLMHLSQYAAANLDIDLSPPPPQKE